MTLSDYKKELKALKGEKGKLSRALGELKRNGESAEQEIADLAEISSRISALTKNIKKLLNSDKETKVDLVASASSASEGAPSKATKEFEALRTQKVSSIVLFDGSELLTQKVNHFVDIHPEGTIYHTSALYHFINNSFKHDKAFFVALNNDTVIGLLPLVRLNSPLFGNFIVSVPYFNYGGLLINNAETAKALAQEASKWQESTNASHIEYRHTQEDIVQLPSRTDKVTFLLPLPATVEQLWSSFKPKLRAQIKRANTATPVCKVGGLELLDDFYHVFSINMRDLGTPVYGKYFFKNALEAFTESANIIVIYINDKPVACAFLLGHKNTLEIPWASTIREFNPIGINMFMYWEVLKFAIDKQYRTFDFGRCSVDCGTYKFKKQWGAKPKPFYWHYSMGEGAELPQLNPDNPKFKLVVAVWKRLPLFVTKLIGPHIVKYLP